MSSAASRSAVPVARLSRVSTTSPLRSSINTCPPVTQLGFATARLSTQHRLQVGRGLMCPIAAFLAVEVHRRIAAPSGRTLGDVALQQPLAVLGEHRHVPHRVVHVQTHKPPKQQVIVQLFHQLPLTANGVQHLQQQRSQHFSGAIEGRPRLAYSLLKRGDNSASASPTIVRSALSGWPCGTRCSAEM
jgi:hypothetical protein